jgi:hypothetical protein
MRHSFDLVGLELATPDPLANRLFPDFEQRSDVLDLEELELGWRGIRHG